MSNKKLLGIAAGFENKYEEVPSFPTEEEIEAPSTQRSPVSEVKENLFTLVERNSELLERIAKASAILSHKFVDFDAEMSHLSKMQLAELEPKLSSFLHLLNKLIK